MIWTPDGVANHLFCQTISVDRSRVAEGALPRFVCRAIVAKVSVGLGERADSTYECDCRIGSDHILSSRTVPVVSN
jgi:hypothetical protein